MVLVDTKSDLCFYFFKLCKTSITLFHKIKILTFHCNRGKIPRIPGVFTSCNYLMSRKQSEVFEHRTYKFDKQQCWTCSGAETSFLQY